MPRTWKRDLVAGVTVGVVALPLALAFGVSAGRGGAAGVVTASGAGVVAAVLGAAGALAPGAATAGLPLGSSIAVPGSRDRGRA